MVNIPVGFGAVDGPPLFHVNNELWVDDVAVKLVVPAAQRLLGQLNHRIVHGNESVNCGFGAVMLGERHGFQDREKHVRSWCAMSLLLVSAQETVLLSPVLLFAASIRAG